MNREKRRALKKKLNNKASRIFAANRLESLGDDINNVIHDGDSVILNVQRIISRSDYSKKQEEYQQFVESSRDKIFVARQYRKDSSDFSALIELDGVKWLFWYGDLIKVENIQAEEDE